MSQENAPRRRSSSAVRHRARELRQELTPAEQVLWRRLRNRRLAGLKFRRQHPIGRFIADFICVEYRLVIELDGRIHVTRTDYDAARSDWLRAHGYTVIRFKNSEILTELESVLTAIIDQCKPLRKNID